MIAAVIIVAALAVLAVVGDGDGEPSSSSTSEAATAATHPTAGLFPAPWRAPTVPRDAVPPAYAQAWDRARNRADCALLFPLDGGQGMEGAKATSEKTPDDNGWDIFLSSDAGSIEVLGLFDKSSQLKASPETPTYTRTWADGSMAKYAAEVSRATSGTVDPNSSPVEAVLTIPDQTCAYRIYDTLGKDHLEFVFDRLRFMPL